MVKEPAHSAYSAMAPEPAAASTHPESSGSGLRGLSRLVFDGIAGTIGLVETMHGNIARPWSLYAARPGEKTRGITGLVYRSVRGVTQLTGASIDAALALLDPVLAATHPTPATEAARAALNGVLGDHLALTANPLAIPMRLRHNGEPLRLDLENLAAALIQPSGKLVVMVHGLCMSDRQLRRDGHEHGAALARDLGYTPVYLHYNSGLHISINGREFAGLLEELVRAWPVPLEDLVIIGHSMGGLVARSACHYGIAAGHAWPRHLRKLVFLGTPHHGAPMERGGQWFHLALGKSAYTAAFTQLGRVRSAGITDLRYGNLLDGDWQGRDRFEHTGDAREAVPLPEGAQCFAIAADTGSEAGNLRGRLLGDGLVPLSSALGKHEDPRWALPIPASQQWTSHAMHHFDLLSRQEVYERIRLWLAPAEPLAQV
jgi:pimeloyl-ACP methyl ester carboxylesterase